MNLNKKESFLETVKFKNKLTLLLIKLHEDIGDLFGENSALSETVYITNAQLLMMIAILHKQKKGDFEASIEELIECLYENHEFLSEYYNKMVKIIREMK